MAAEYEKNGVGAAVRVLRGIADGLVSGRYVLDTMSGRSEIIENNESFLPRFRTGPRRRIILECLDSVYAPAGDGEVSDWNEFD